MSGIINLFRRDSSSFELCFNIEASSPLIPQEMETLKILLAQGFVAEGIKTQSLLKLKSQSRVIELGPRMNFETAYSTNAVAICQACGLNKITRVEVSRRYVLPVGMHSETFVADNHDRMTEMFYPKILTTFNTSIKPEEVWEIPMREKGPDVLLDIAGLAMDDFDRNYYYDYFVGKLDRNPTIVEIQDLNNANSEHCRHGFFKGKQIIDGVKMSKTLLEIIQSTLKANPNNSLIAFCDNSSAIYGFDIRTIIPEKPGQVSAFKETQVKYHIIFTAETHNYPSGIAPFPGSNTGTGGRIRDDECTGRGGLVVAATAGYCAGNLYILEYPLYWEDFGLPRPENLATPLQILIGASDGASDYGNKFGEPVIAGFARSFDLKIPGWERWGWLKPIMFSGGIGQIDDRHIKKEEPEKGMLIVQVGGPAYRIGVGGGAASSFTQGANEAALDFNAVQRGNPEMEQKMNRVIRACVEMGDKTPIRSIHDQGAGGPANVLKELVEKSGGTVGIRKINVGDPTLSVMEIWIAEYQERNGFIIQKDRIEEFQQICAREKVPCEILGEVTGDGIFTVIDSQNNTTPVKFELSKVLGGIPQKNFTDKRVTPELQPLKLPNDLTVQQALERVLRLVSVGSKRFLTNKVDRSVTGLIAQQQSCGAVQLPLSNVGVIAQSHFGLTGAATAIGEKPINMLVNPKAGARMAVAEMLFNMVWAKITNLTDIKCSANWMWSKLPGEKAALYDAAQAMAEFMIKFGIAVDGGKDSMSMATKVGGEMVKSPRQLVISGYATMTDIRKVVTPDIKKPGKSTLIFVDLSSDNALPYNTRNSLGGSALAQVFSQIGAVSPDTPSSQTLIKAFNLIQEFIDKDLLLAGHDRSDGGLITTLLEMAFAGNCGIKIDMGGGKENILAKLFSEELGVVMEIETKNIAIINELFTKYGLVYSRIGHTIESGQVEIEYNQNNVLSEKMIDLRAVWEETSYQLIAKQSNPVTARVERQNIFDRPGMQYIIPAGVYDDVHIITASQGWKVAILREEGTNGDREMTSAFRMAGFEVWDVMMTDLLAGKINLSTFRGVVFPGGFSYSDTLGSAKGWAAVIRFNKKLKKMFDDFYNRSDTFSLGVCNGCQLMALLGWVPWRGIPDEQQPRFIQNGSKKFESRWVTTKIFESPAIMFKGMEGSILGVWVAHGEGKLFFPDTDVFDKILEDNLIPLAYTGDDGWITENYPYNPNGSPDGITGLCSPDGRHLAMMPHLERAFLKWQWPYVPPEWNWQNDDNQMAPWFKPLQNAYNWCVKN